VSQPFDQVDGVHGIEDRPKRRLLAGSGAKANHAQILERDAKIASFDSSFFPPSAGNGV
jgi:hypothetical protein